MNNSYIRTILLSIALVALQAWVFNPLAIFRVATPMLYPVLLFLVPVSRGPISLTLFGFVIGALIDYFSFSPGLHASAFTLTAFARYYLVQYMLDAQDNEDHLPFPVEWQGRAYVLLAYILLVHHLLIYLLSAGLHADWLFVLIRFVAGYALSYVLCVFVLLTISIRPNIRH